MAYTYDDFLTAANKSGMLPEFSQEDLQITQRYPEYGLGLLTLRQDASKATTPEGKLLAQESENQLRKTYSTVVGESQTPGLVIGQTPSTGSQAGAGQATQQPSLEGVGNTPQVTQGSFQYNPEEDPRFIAYKKAYLREGDRAAENALAKASALTGGVPSTAAITASQQAGDYYAGKLADIIPELYGDAYNQHITEQQLQDDREQQKIANALNLYKTLGYATPEIAEILGLQSSSGGNAGGDQQTGGGTSSGTGSGTGGTANWDNGDYSRDQIKTLQEWLIRETGIPLATDGLFGDASKDALVKAGYSSLEQVMLEQPWLQGPGGGTEEPENTGTTAETGSNSWTGSLSAGGMNFMKSVPMASPGTNIDDWKAFVNNQLLQAYAAGDITPDDVLTITEKLGL